MQKLKRIAMQKIKQNFIVLKSSGGRAGRRSKKSRSERTGLASVCGKIYFFFILICELFPVNSW